MAYPTNYRYTREHEWISLDGKIGTVGITDYAQNSLGDIVYVDVPKVGDSITANASFGSVESVKAVERFVLACHRHCYFSERGAKDQPRQDQRGAARSMDHKGRTGRSVAV